MVGRDDDGGAQLAALVVRWVLRGDGGGGGGGDGGFAETAAFGLGAVWMGLDFESGSGHVGVVL